MTPEERKRILSNDYADLLIAYTKSENILTGFPNGSYEILNESFALVHIPVSAITENIVLEQGYSVMPTCFGMISNNSFEASGIDKLRNIPRLNLRGQGVLLGFVDSGIEYTNPVFQKADGSTRIVSIWDQSIDSEDRNPEGTFYGTEFNSDDINNALKNQNPLTIVPSKDDVGHGTMLAGIAAGSETPDQKFSGVVPDSELIVVKLKPAKPYLKEFFRIPQDVTCYQENDIMLGLQYLIRIAEKLNRPIAICVAIGTSQGAHDGRGSLSNYLSLLGDTTGVGIVVAAGNEGNAKRHYYGTVDPAVGYDTVELRIGEKESGFTMELWGDSPSVFSIDILSPSGEYIPRIPARLDDYREISFLFEQTKILVNYQMIESQSGDQLILVRFQNPTPGIWRFKVYGKSDLTLGFNVWLPMDHFMTDETYFLKPNPYDTVLSLGNSYVPIIVTAYNTTDNSLYANASKGYSRDNYIVPQIAAPGVNILAPAPGNTFAEVTGSSAAAAHTTGVTAMLLEWGIINENYTNMSSTEIKKFLIRGAQRRKDLTYPNQDWGYGILNAYNTFNNLRNINE